MSLRPLARGDLALILSWRNAPRVRLRMLSTAEIAWEDHLRWFAGLEGDPSRRWFVYSDANGPAGVVYFTGIAAGAATWGLYTGEGAPPGTGLTLAREALDLAFGPLALHTLRAEIRPDNERSLHLHARCGFLPDTAARESAPLTFTLRASDWARARAALPAASPTGDS